MNLANLLLNKWVIMALLIAGAYAIGYYLSPDKIKIKIQEKIIYKTKTVKEENKKVTKKYDPKTGKIIEETVETGSKETEEDLVRRDKTEEKEISKTKKNYALKLGQRFDVDYSGLGVGLGRAEIGGEIRIPQIAFSPGWVGAEVDTKGDFGLYLRWEF